MLINNKVLVGFSGGADSTAAVILLKKAGYEVVGFSFDVLNSEPNQKTLECAEKLGIRLIFKSVKNEFSETVINPFKDAYESGITPNPCIICNPNMKFKQLIEVADAEGIKYISTGHYAGIQRVGNLHYIKKARNLSKDQSYMLYRLPQSVLSRLILPLAGAYSKEDIRTLLSLEGMPNAQEKDSQDICFIPDGNYFEYLLSAGAKNCLGNFLDTNGNVLGQHKGILNYTIGQRKGLGMSFGKPAYVVDIKGNDVVIGDEEDLYSYEVSIADTVWTGAYPPLGMELSCKLRYSAKDAKCRLRASGDGKFKLVFNEAQRAATPGQSAVLYNNSLVLGGGIIVK